MVYGASGAIQLRYTNPRRETFSSLLGLYCIAPFPRGIQRYSLADKCPVCPACPVLETEANTNNGKPNEKREQVGRWLKGTPPPNPAGRPLAARQRISEKLLADLADVWEAHGKSILERLAMTEPGKLAQIAYGLLPRDVFISVEQLAPGNLEPSEWATLRRVLDVSAGIILHVHQ
jgi:hypothetical protein